MGILTIEIHYLMFTNPFESEANFIVSCHRAPRYSIHAPILCLEFNGLPLFNRPSGMIQPQSHSIPDM